jgi:Domain of unknown function (DUF4166)
MAELAGHARSQMAAPTLLQTALGDAWQQLPRSVRRLHSVQEVESFSGRACIRRGRGLLARLAGWFFQFPTAGDAVELTITKTRTSSGEIWERNFAGRSFRSLLTPSLRPAHYRERFGPFRFEQELPLADGALHFVVRRGWFLGIPLPFMLLPRSCSKEFEVDGTFHFDVGIYAPLTGELIVRYRGELAAGSACAPSKVAASPLDRIGPTPMTGSRGA